MIAASMVAMVLAASEPLSLAEVVESARAQFPTMLAASADVEAAAGERLAAAGAFDPIWRTRAWNVPVSIYPQTRLDTTIEVPTPLWGATFFGGYRLGVGKFQAYYGERETWSAGELRAGAVVPLIRNGPIDRRRANEARAELGKSIAHLSRSQQELEVVRIASHRYWDWVAAGAREDIARALLEIAQARDAQLKVRSTAGDVARFDQQDNLRALVQREALLVQARRGVEAAAFELSLFVRDDQSAPTIPARERLARLPDAPPRPEIDLAAALERRPDVKRLEDQRRSAEVELDLQKNQLLPALDVGVIFSGDLGTPNSSSISPLGPAELEVNAVLEVPILYRAPLGRIDAARAARSRLSLQLQLARERAALEVNDALSALNAALQRVDLARREVVVAEEVEAGERRRFELGESSLLFVNIREQTTAEARLRTIDALADAHKALATLRAAAALSPDMPLK